MIAYKLVRQRKDGSIGPLFINRRQRISTGEWLKAECVPTKGFAVRKGWHVTARPSAPHLSMKDRVWIKVEIDDYESFQRPRSQGGMWLIAQKMKVLQVGLCTQES